MIWCKVFSFFHFLNNTFLSPCNESHYNAAPSVAPRHPWTLLATADKAGGFLVGSAGAAAPLIWAPLKRGESGGTTGAPEEGTATFQYHTPRFLLFFYPSWNILFSGFWGTGAEFISYIFSFFICIFDERWVLPPEVSFVNAKCIQISFSYWKGKDLLPVECLGVAWTLPGEAISRKWARLGPSNPRGPGRVWWLEKRGKKWNLKAGWLQATALITVWLLELIYCLNLANTKLF